MAGNGRQADLVARTSMNFRSLPEPLVATGRFREAIIPITHQVVDRLVAVI
jgi:hypothetical protein